MTIVPDLAEYLAAEGFAVDSKTSPLIAVERDALLAVRFLQEELPGLQDEVMVDPMLFRGIDSIG